MLTRDDYFDYYKSNKRLPNESYLTNRSKPLNDNQLQSKYEKYVKQENHKEAKRDADFKKRVEEAQLKEFKEDSLWSTVKDIVYKRDMYSCRFEKILSFEELKLYEKNFPKFLREIIDPAHVFGKGAYPHQKYEVDNIMCISRAAHSCLDQNRDPVTGVSISLKEKNDWWKRIIGEAAYEKLRLKSIEK